MLHKKYFLIMAAFAGVSAVKSQPNESPNEGFLVNAIVRNDAAEVERLLKAGANVNDATWGTTPLREAVDGGHEEFVRELIRAGADVNVPNTYNGDTPLIEAIDRASDEIVRELIWAGADANLANRYGRTPLESAVREGREWVIRELLLAGAKPLSDDKLTQILGYLELNAPPGEFQKRIQSIKRLQQRISQEHREALGQFAEQMDIEHDVPRDLQRLIIRDVLGTAKEQLPEFQKRR